MLFPTAPTSKLAASSSHCPFHAERQAGKRWTPILQSLVWPDWESNQSLQLQRWTFLPLGHLSKLGSLASTKITATQLNKTTSMTSSNDRKNKAAISVLKQQHRLCECLAFTTRKKKLKTSMLIKPTLGWLKNLVLLSWKHSLHKDGDCLSLIHLCLIIFSIAEMPNCLYI